MSGVACLVGRELDAMARRRGFVVGVCAHAAVMAAIVIAWSSGASASIIPPHSFYRDVRALQLLVLAMVLPWTAMRCVSPERGNDLVLLSAITATRPSTLVAVRTAALLIAIAVVTVAGLPVAVLALRMSGEPATMLATDEMALQAVTVASAAAVLSSQFLCRDRLLSWLSATGAMAVALVLALAFTPSRTSAMAALGVAAFVVLTTLLVRSDRSLLYLEDVRQ